MPRNNSTPNVIEIKSNEVIVIEDSNGSTIEVVSNAIVVPGLVTATGEGGAVVRDVVTHTQIDPIIDQIQNDIIIERNARVETDTTLASEIISLQVNDVDLQQEFENVRQTTTNAIMSLQVKDVDLQQQIDAHQTSLDLIASSVNDAEVALADFAVQLEHRVRFDAPQSLTNSEKQQARENIGAASAAQGSKADTALQADDLAIVAFTNDYNDLSNKPVLSSQVNSDWNSESGPSEILNKPNLSNVATSGSYNDLADKPTIYQLSTTDPIGPSNTPHVGIENTVARADHVHPLPTSEQITSSALTGLTQGSASPISSADTVLQAFSKLQAQSDAIYNASSGNTLLQNAIYEEGILSYTGGTINNHPAMTMTFPLSAASSGILTMSENSGGVLYIAVISGNTLPPSTPSLAITVGNNAIGLYDTSYAVMPGTEVPLQWTDNSISAYIDGEWRTQSAAPIFDPHVLFFEISGGIVAPVYVAINGLSTSAGTSGMLPDEISARAAGDAQLSAAITNKADQSSLDTLSMSVDAVSSTLSNIQINIQDQIDAIYTPAHNPPVVTNGTFVDGVLHYTGGTLGSSFYGLNYAGLMFDHAASLRITGSDFDVWVDGLSSYNSGPYGSENFMRVKADGITLSIMHRDQTGFHTLPTIAYTPGLTVDLTFSDTILRVEHDGNVHESPPLSTPVSGPKTKFLASVDTSVIDLEAAARGVLQQEIEDRQAGDALLSAQIVNKADQSSLDALADTVDNVQTLAQVNQLNILEKADQSDVDALQTTVIGHGISLLQKADQTALDALSTVVNGKATSADITAAISALVNGAPDALNTLSEIATALAGEQAQIADLLAALAMRVRVDAAQSLTLAQQLQARQNINAEQVGVAANLVANITPTSIGAATAVQGAKADTALQSSDLAPVAFSGDYSALLGRPTALSAFSNDIGYATTAQLDGKVSLSGSYSNPSWITSLSYAKLSGTPTLANVATSGSYNDLSDKPTISSNVRPRVGPKYHPSGDWYDASIGQTGSIGITNIALSTGAMWFVPFQVLETCTIDQLGINVVSGTSGSVIKMGIFDSDANNYPRNALVATSYISSAASGDKTESVSLTLYPANVYWLAYHTKGGIAPTVKVLQYYSTWIMGGWLTLSAIGAPYTGFTHSSVNWLASVTDTANLIKTPLVHRTMFRLA